MAVASIFTSTLTVDSNFKILCVKWWLLINFANFNLRNYFFLLVQFLLFIVTWIWNFIFALFWNMGFVSQIKYSTWWLIYRKCLLVSSKENIDTATFTKFVIETSKLGRNECWFIFLVNIGLWRPLIDLI